MSPPKTGYIAPESQGGDGQTHATRRRGVAAQRTFSYCGREDSNHQIHPVAIFMTYANNPACRECVAGIEAELHPKRGEA